MGGWCNAIAVPRSEWKGTGTERRWGGKGKGSKRPGERDALMRIGMLVLARSTHAHAQAEELSHGRTRTCARLQAGRGMRRRACRCAASRRLFARRGPNDARVYVGCVIVCCTLHVPCTSHLGYAACRTLHVDAPRAVGGFALRGPGPAWLGWPYPAVHRSSSARARPSTRASSSSAAARWCVRRRRPSILIPHERHRRAVRDDPPPQLLAQSRCRCGSGGPVPCTARRHVPTARPPACAD